MKKGSKNPARGAVLKEARLAKGAKLREVAAAMSEPVTPQAVSNWESGGDVTMPNMIALGLFLEIDPIAANEGRLVTKSNPGLAPTDATPPILVPHPLTGPRDVEMLGVTVGGDDADFHFNGNVERTVARPSGLIGARDVFALTVVGGSVIPRYYPGEVIYVQKRAYLPGDYIVIEMYPDGVDLVGKSFVKRYVNTKGSAITCLQHNPEAEIQYDKGLIKNVFRIFPPNELFT